MDRTDHLTSGLTGLTSGEWWASLSADQALHNLESRQGADEI